VGGGAGKFPSFSTGINRRPYNIRFCCCFTATVVTATVIPLHALITCTPMLGCMTLDAP